MSGILLAVSLSADALGIGSSYGIKSISIKFKQRIIIGITAVIISASAMLLGRGLSSVISGKAADIISTVMLLILGGYMLIHGIIGEITEKRIFIKPLRISIHITRYPLAGDIDNSKSIEGVEAVYLALALSLDSLGVSFSCGMGMNFSLFMPLLIGLFQMFFLSVGIFLGSKMKKALNEKFIAVLPGVIILIICAFRLLNYPNA